MGTRGAAASSFGALQLGLIRFSDLRCALSFNLFLNLAGSLFLSAALLILNGALLRFLAEPGFFDFPLTLFDIFPLAGL